MTDIKPTVHLLDDGGSAVVLRCDDHEQALDLARAAWFDPLNGVYSADETELDLTARSGWFRIQPIPPSQRCDVAWWLVNVDEPTGPHPGTSRGVRITIDRVIDLMAPTETERTEP